MQAVALLAETPQPSEQQIEQAMAGNLCRCGTYNRIKSAIRRAAKSNESMAVAAVNTALVDNEATEVRS
jgi:isoquinoline 1-oxidoreductase alpha subunit